MSAFIMVGGNIEPTFRPMSEALFDADPTLLEMTRYTRHMLDLHDPSKIAHKAAWFISSRSQLSETRTSWS